ncbi:hypothetical protein ABZZ47_03480 [Streptomyces sp. NPDC006465]|uniref:hypothetical protein n=1 Tax=Streptomyces sp. NPDC006465 TaxID=3157174 RepID=UPI0033AB97E6
MGVGISPDRGERAERAAGGRSERTPEPETELLAGLVTEDDTFSGRASEAGSPSGHAPAAWFTSTGSADAGPALAARTAETRPFFDDGPETELLSGPVPDLDGPLPSSWEHPEDPEHTHDPHEVTVQLDGAGRRLDDWLVQQAKGAPTTQEASDGPVFVDESGRRSRRFRRLGMLVAVACAVYAVVIVATLLSGNSNAPWLPVPGQEKDQPAGQVDTSPLPSQPVDPSGTGNATAPGAVATASDGTTPSPGSTPAPGASDKAASPGASSDPKPTTSTTKKPKPGATTKDPDPGPSNPVVDPPTDTATATTPGATADPTETAGTGDSAGTGAGTEAVAFSVVMAPVAQVPGESAQSGVLGSTYSLSLPSPENLL